MRPSPSITVLLIDGIGRDNRPSTVLHHATRMMIAANLLHKSEMEIETMLFSPRDPSVFGLGIQWVEIPHLTYADYNNFVIRDLGTHINSDHCLLVQEDGYPINPAAWAPEFLEYDYIGAPWPVRLVQAGESYRVGNGGFSLRSRRLLELGRDIPVTGGNEDVALCQIHRDELEAKGIKFAPPEVAARFSKEFKVPENDGGEHFGFHAWIGDRKERWGL